MGLLEPKPFTRSITSHVPALDPSVRHSSAPRLDVAWKYKAPSYTLKFDGCALAWAPLIGVTWYTEPPLVANEFSQYKFTKVEEDVDAPKHRRAPNAASAVGFVTAVLSSSALRISTVPSVFKR